MYSAFAIELSDLSKPFKFARLKGFERLENCLTKGTFERWNNSLNKHTFIIGVYHSPICLPFKSFQRECFKRFRNIDSHFASKQILKDFERSNHRRVKRKYTLEMSVNAFILYKNEEIHVSSCVEINPRKFQLNLWKYVFRLFVYILMCNFHVTKLIINLGNDFKTYKIIAPQTDRNRDIWL